MNRLQMESAIRADALPYAPGTIALATKHWKEEAIAPPFAEHLGAALYVPRVDTDSFGTFTGEIARAGSAVETAKKKARLGMQVTQLACGLASEGSFAGHPFLPNLAHCEEVMVFVDLNRSIEVVETLITTETNYATGMVSSVEGALEFARSVHFPTHGVIVSPAEVTDPAYILKDASTPEQLMAAAEECLRVSPVGQAVLYTDMRAHKNPTRMRVIGLLADRLARRLATPCPACLAPGWGRMRAERGLPCARCGSETRMELGWVVGCPVCDYTQLVPREDGQTHAPEAQCDYCNP
jgi:hypothetical protein